MKYCECLLIDDKIIICNENHDGFLKEKPIYKHAGVTKMLFKNFKILSAFFFFTASLSGAMAANEDINADGLKYITANSDCGDDVMNVNSYNLANVKWETINKSICIEKHKCSDSMVYKDNCFVYLKIIANAKGDPLNSKGAQELIDAVRPEQKKESKGVIFSLCTDIRTLEQMQAGHPRICKEDIDN